MASPGARLRTYLAAFLPALLWQALILWLSGSWGSGLYTQSLVQTLNDALGLGLSLPAVVLLNKIIRKCGHVVLYMILALLLYRGFRPMPNGAQRAAAGAWGVVLALLLASASLDEFRQSFIPTRQANISDVLLDSFGGAIAWAGVWVRSRWRNGDGSPARKPPKHGP